MKETQMSYLRVVLWVLGLQNKKIVIVTVEVRRRYHDNTSALYLLRRNVKKIEPVQVDSGHRWRAEKQC